MILCLLHRLASPLELLLTMLHTIPIGQLELFFLSLNTIREVVQCFDAFDLLFDFFRLMCCVRRIANTHHLTMLLFYCVTVFLLTVWRLLNIFSHTAVCFLVPCHTLLPFRQGWEPSATLQASFKHIHIEAFIRTESTCLCCFSSSNED